VPPRRDCDDPVEGNPKSSHPKLRVGTQDQWGLAIASLEEYLADCGTALLPQPYTSGFVRPRHGLAKPIAVGSQTDCSEAGRPRRCCNDFLGGQGSETTNRASMSPVVRTRSYRSRWSCR
jgi:hypothetical protein